MIRANLLVHSKDAARVFGFPIDTAIVRRAATALSTAAFVAALGVGVEEVRLHRLQRVAVARDAALARNAPERAVAKQLALDVARYQAFDRAANGLRRSGTSAAIAIALIGNTVPATVWLEALDREADGYTLQGGSASIDALSRTMISLGDALPGSNASFESIDNHEPILDGVRFRARLRTVVADPVEGAR